MGKGMRVAGAGLVVMLGAAMLPSMASAEFDAGILVDEHYDGYVWDDLEMHYPINDHINGVDNVTADSVAIHGEHAHNGAFPEADHDGWDD